MDNKLNMKLSIRIAVVIDSLYPNIYLYFVLKLLVHITCFKEQELIVCHERLHK